MDESPRFESPVVKTYPPGESALTLADRSSTRKTVVRAAPEAYVGAQLRVGFGASTTIDDVLVCGQRPGEWVLLGTTAATTALTALLDLSGHVSVVDLTHGLALFRLTGELAPAVLEKVCSLDWSDDMTPDGAVVSGSVAKVVCDIVRDDEAGSRSYLVACDRSFGQYLFDALLDAGDEFDITGTP